MSQSVYSVNRKERDNTYAVLATWEAFASGDVSALGDRSGHIAAAHEIGRSLMSTKDNQRPLFIRMAVSRTWLVAAHLLRDELPSDDRAKLNASDLFSGEWPRRHDAARLMAKHFDDKPCDDLKQAATNAEFAKCCELLAVDPRDWNDTAWAVGILRQHIAAGEDHEEDAMLAGWRRLANGRIPKGGNSSDPFALASLASAERSAAEVETDNAIEEDEPEVDVSAAPEPPGIIVLARVGGTTKSSTAREVEQEFKAIVGKRLPLALAPDLARLRPTLTDEYPHLTAQIDVLLTGLIRDEPIAMPPTLLVGEAGGGKSRLARRIAEELGLPLHRFDATGSSDNAFGGTPRRWSSGEHCIPLEAVRRGMVANPVVLVDEIDKAGSSRHNGSLDRALLPFLEPENAKAYPDPYIQSDVNLGHVNFLLTANDATLLPAPFRDRLRIVMLPHPALEHLPQLARTLVADIAKTRGGDQRWFPPLEDHELAIAEMLWRGGSVRRLRAIVERIVAYREANPRH